MILGLARDIPATVLGQVMPRHARHEWPLTDRRPLVEVSLVPVGLPQCILEKATALIDTGSDVTRIEGAIVPTGLRPCREVHQLVEQPDGTYVPDPRALFAFTLTFLGTPLEPVLIEAMPWPIEKVTPGIWLLLGTEFLRRYAFTYNGERSVIALET